MGGSAGQGAAPGPATFRQLALPFAHRPAFERADLIATAGNAAALAWLEPGAHRSWPSRRLALSGPAGSGKTHLLHVWAAEQDAVLIPGTALDHGASALVPFADRRPVAVDDADTAPDQRALLHLLNAARDNGVPLLITAREPPSRWIAARHPAPLPDLGSRLRATHAVPIDPPTDATLRLLLCRLLVERQLSAPPTVLDWILSRLPRDPATLRDAARRLDEAALATGRPISRALAAAVLPDLLPPADDPADPPGTERYLF
ncbi:MAG: chromosomal replication initiator DnaA [Gluconacetobacter diazotrophicus]|nr:chromosomal replication initiator DnaA [Gluconacetobacter diazotrophicus]